MNKTKIAGIGFYVPEQIVTNNDLKKYMDVIYHQWFPKSDYEKVALPSFALYHKNHFLEADEQFVLDFCVPVRFK